MYMVGVLSLRVSSSSLVRARSSPRCSTMRRSTSCNDEGNIHAPGMQVAERPLVVNDPSRTLLILPASRKSLHDKTRSCPEGCTTYSETRRLPRGSSPSRLPSPTLLDVTAVVRRGGLVSEIQLGGIRIVSV